MSDEKTSAGALRVGLFGIGLDTYWPQFAGLEDRLKGYLGRVEEKLRRPGVEVVSLGLIDTPEKAAVAGHRVPPGRRGPHLPLRDDLRALRHRPAGRAPGQGAGDRAQSLARGRHRLRSGSTPSATARR